MKALKTSRVQSRGIAGSFISYGQRLKKREGKLVPFDIQRDDIFEYIGMSIGSAKEGEFVLYV